MAFDNDTMLAKRIKQLLLLLICLPAAGIVTAQRKARLTPTDGKSIPAVGVIRGLTDDQLLEVVERQTFRFFWYGADPVSGLALDRSTTTGAAHDMEDSNEWKNEPDTSRKAFGPNACAIGGTGFGIMATIVAAERHWIGRDTALGRLAKIVGFLQKADCFHGIFPHFMDGHTGKAIGFGPLDDAADIVETSYLMMGLLCAREYFDKDTPREKGICATIDQLWQAANWNWHTNNSNKLYWHWSPNNGFGMNFPVRGWNECLVTYILAASSPHHSIAKSVYDTCWTGSNVFLNGKTYYGMKLPLGNYDCGGPLFFEQYSFMGIDPSGLKDALGIDYSMQVKNHTLINRSYCIENPKKYKGYSSKCWGLTAGDNYNGYAAHCPETDLGVIQPTAAISSMPFTPVESMEALRYFYYKLGKKIWGSYGFTDGFSIDHNWYAQSYLAIDQGPIIVMIENYRSGLVWKLLMKNKDVQNGLKRLGFSSPWLSAR